jgi:hypothetical protein
MFYIPPLMHVALEYNVLSKLATLNSKVAKLERQSEIVEQLVCAAFPPPNIPQGSGYLKTDHNFAFLCNCSTPLLSVMIQRG